MTYSELMAIERRVDEIQGDLEAYRAAQRRAYVATRRRPTLRAV